MSAPETNVEKQAKRHRGPLVGIILALVVAVGAAIFFTGADDIAEEDAASAAASE